MADLVSTVWVTDPKDNQPTAFAPGDEVPEWARKQMGDHCFTDGAADTEGEEGSADYSKLKVADLQAEIDARNEGRAEEGQIVPDGDKKADLVAALEADDAQGA